MQKQVYCVLNIVGWLLHSLTSFSSGSVLFQWNTSSVNLCRPDYDAGNARAPLPAAHMAPDRKDRLHRWWVHDSLCRANPGRATDAKTQADVPYLGKARQNLHSFFTEIPESLFSKLRWLDTTEWGRPSPLGTQSTHLYFSTLKGIRWGLLAIWIHPRWYTFFFFTSSICLASC